jgi:hypothetical protein
MAGQHWLNSQVRGDWDRARRQALWEAVVDALKNRSGELLPLEELRTRLNVRGSHYLGLQHVPLEKIVGSEGRYADFDRRFLPRKDQTASRWMSIDQAQYKEVPLPPVELYKIGDIYFVRDGNHRVSVARQRGQYDIDAYVTEYEVDVPLDSSFSMRDLLLKEEYSDFLDWTQLARLRPEQRIELSALGGYLDLINHINTHRYYMAQERNGPVTAEEAITSWYDNVYRPVIEAIRKHNILRSFPGRTEADLYLWIMQHRWSMLESAGGVDPGPELAVLDYAQRYRPRSLLGTVAEAAQTLAAATRSLTRSEEARPTEERDFVEWSHVDRLCPDVELELTNPADYGRLRAHIEEHQYYLGTQWNRPVGTEEAVRHWCDNLYQPMIAAIRERQLLDDWPGHTETELYLEAMDQRRELEGRGEPAGPTEAAATLQSRLRTTGHNRGRTLLTRVRRLLRLDASE